MNIRWMGHSCFAMETSRGTRIVTDPFDEQVGYPLPWGPADVATISHGHFDHNHYERMNPKQVADEAKEYVFHDVKIRGIESFHDEEEGAKRGKNVIFVIEADGKRVAHLGDLGHELSAEQAAAIGHVDALMIPVGGVYTITGEQAAKQARQIDAEAVLPMHYRNEWCKFDISDLNPFLQSMNEPFEESDCFEPGTEFAPIIVMQLSRRGE